jgi:hypothetical protein
MNDMRKLMETASALDYDSDVIDKINSRDRLWAVETRWRYEDRWEGIKSGLHSEEEAQAVLKYHLKKWFDNVDKHIEDYYSITGGATGNDASITRKLSNPNYYQCWIYDPGAVWWRGFQQGEDLAPNLRKVLDREYRITNNDI